MKILELFSGTRSFSKECEKRGHKVITLDWEKKFNPNILIDIMDLEKYRLKKVFGQFLDSSGGGGESY